MDEDDESSVGDQSSRSTTTLSHQEDAVSVPSAEEVEDIGDYPPSIPESELEPEPEHPAQGKAPTRKPYPPYVRVLRRRGSDVSEPDEYDSDAENRRVPLLCTEGVRDEMVTAVYDGSKVTLVPNVTRMTHTSRSLTPLQIGQAMYNLTGDFDSIQRIKDDVYIAQATGKDRSGRPLVEASLDPYIDDDVEMKYLMSQPTCYIILGKPSVHAFKLGQWMAEEYGCVHVDVEMVLVAEAEKLPPREDHCILMQTVLRNGGTVPIISVVEVVLAALCSESVQHRGYVLTGFPIYPQNQCEPLVQLKYIWKLDLNPDVFILITCPDKDFLHMHASLKYDYRLGKAIDTFTGYSRKEVAKPEVVEAEEEDEWDGMEDDENNNQVVGEEAMAEEVKEVEVNQQEVEVNQQEVEVNQQEVEVTKLEEVTGEELEGEEEEESISEPEEPGFNHGACLTNVLTSECAQDLLNEYKSEVLPVIELLLLDHDPSKVLKLDARTSFEDMRENARVWFATVPIQAVVDVEMVDYNPPTIQDSILSLVKYDIYSNESLVGERPTIDSAERVARQSFESYQPAHIRGVNLPFSSSLFSLPEDDEDRPRAMFNIFSKYNAIDSCHTWTWSKWQTVCPVGLVEGRYLEGIPELACRFMGHIYFMSSNDAVEKFKENPRRYLMPPQPRLPRRICIVGPELCGETSIAARLGRDLGLQVVNFVQVATQALAAKRADMVQLVRYEALGDAVVQINQASIDSYLATTSSSSNEMGKVRGWDMRIVDYLQDYLYTKDRFLQERIHRAFPLLYIPEIEEGQDDEPCHAEYRKHFPDLIRIPMPPPPYNRISIDSIIRYCDFQVDRYLQIDTDMSHVETGHEVGLVLKAIQDELDEETSGGGWILDGVPLIEDLWKSLEDEGTYPTHVIYLQNEDYSYEEYTNGLSLNEPTLVPKYLESSMSSLEKEEHVPCSSVRQLSRQLETLDLLSMYASDMTIKSNLSWMHDHAISMESIPPIFSDVFMGTRVPLTEENKELLNDDWAENLQAYCDYAEALKDYPDDWKTYKKLLKGKALITELDVTNTTTKQRADFVIGERNDVFEERPYYLSRVELEERFNIIDSEGSESSSESDSSSDDSSVSSDEEGDVFTARNVDEYKEIESFEDEEEEDDSWSDDSSSLDSYSEESSESEEESFLSVGSYSDSESDSESDLDAQFGDTGECCPVLFVKHNVLSPGKKNFACEYKNRIYYLSSYETIEEFFTHPELYCNFPGPLQSPPLRICLVGSDSSGKTTVAAQLAREIGIHHIDFLKEFIEANWKEGTPQLGRQYEDTYDVAHLLVQPSIYDTDSSRSFFLEDIEEEDESALTTKREDSEAEFKRQNALREYMRYNLGIAESFVQPHVQYLWKTWPYCGDGLLLDGFPRTLADMSFMEKFALRPDVIVELRIPPEATVERLFDCYLSEWDKRNAVRVVEKEEDDTRRLAIYEEGRPRLLNELLNDYLESEATYWDEIYELREEFNVPWWDKYCKRLEEIHSMSDPDLMAKELRYHSLMRLRHEHHEEDEEIDEHLQREYTMKKAIEEALDIVDDEYPEFKSRFELEWPVDAEIRLDEELRNWNDLDSTTLDSMRHYANSNDITWLIVDGDRDEEEVVANVKLIQDECFWELPPVPLPQTLPVECRVIPVEDAERLLRAGYYFISQFGRWCPVQLRGSPERRRMFLPDKGMSPTCIAVIHRKYIYFIADEDCLAYFEQDPNLYINTEICTRTTPISISIVGLSKIGKSSVAQALGEELQMRVITRCSAIKYVLEELPWTELAASMQLDLRQGKKLPAHKAMQAVQACMMDARGTVKGYIFDGFPDKCAESYTLSMCDIVPTLVLVLQAPMDKILRMYQVTQEKGLLDVPRRPYSSAHIRARMYHWFQTLPNYLRWINIKYQNVFVVDGSYTFWHTKLLCLEHIDRAALALAAYDRSVIQGLTVPLQHCCITPRLYLQYQSDFMHFCPGCLLMRVRTTGGFPCKSSGMVQYKSFIYWLCELHYEPFLNGPEVYVRPTNAEQFNAEEAKPVVDYLEHQVFDNGLCPITHIPGRGKWLRVQGNPILAVKYKRHVYLFADLATQIEFMRTPEEYYCGAFYLPVPKMDPEKEVIGFGLLEHALSKAVIGGVKSLGHRPMLPGLSIEQSAAVMMGMFIQSENYRYPQMQEVGEYTLDRAYEFMHTRDLIRAQYLKRNVLRYVVGSEMVEELESRTLLEEGIRGYAPSKPDIPNSLNWVEPKVTGIIAGPKRADVTKAIELLYASHRRSVLDGLTWPFDDE